MAVAPGWLQEVKEEQRKSSSLGELPTHLLLLLLLRVPSPLGLSCPLLPVGTVGSMAPLPSLPQLHLSGAPEGGETLSC